MSARFTPHDLIACYQRGVFPMAESRDDPSLFIIDPDRRGILPLDAFHVPRRLKRTLRQDPYSITLNRAFVRVMEGCAEPAEGRENTWINPLIVNLYGALNRMGYAHSLEVWEDGRLVGGLYGVALGGAFFGESMFARARDASKVALVHLVGRLIRSGYRLLDAQFHNPHLEQFGLIEIDRMDFKALLAEALTHRDLPPLDVAPLPGSDAVDIIERFTGEALS